jgi:UDP-glucose 4-epimerase
VTKVVVFGGSGFLGLHVVQELLGRGHEVVVGDLTPVPQGIGAGHVRVDICDLDAVRRATAGARYVYNFAAIADIDEAAEDPVAVARVNVLGNVHVLDACVQHGVEKVLFASSIYVNSNSGLFYRTSKLASEKFIEDYAAKFGLKYTILRYGSVYGPGSGRANVIARYIRQALQEGRMVRQGDGEELREYIHVRDAAVGAVRVLGEEFDNTHVVISGIQAMRVRDLLEMIREILQNRVKIEYNGASPLTHYRVTPYAYNPSMARKVILESYYDLGQGLLDLIIQTDAELTPGHSPKT